jgi:ATP synthase protein I
MPSDDAETRNRISARASWASSSIGWTMVADILTGTFLFGGIGWLVDRWLGIAPWAMVVGFVGGHGMGIYAAMLHMKRMQQAAPPLPHRASRPVADDQGGGW